MKIAVLIAAVLLQSSQDMRPFLGISASVHETPIAAGDETFPHGLLVYFVTPDSGAAAAGIQVDDVIVGIAGVDWSSPASALPQRFIDAVGQRARGDTIRLRVVRDGELLTFEPELGVRPTQNPVSRAIPSNDEILPAGVPDTDAARFAAAVVAHFEFGADYAKLRERLARLVEQGDPFRLCRVAYILREPFAIEPLSRAAADLPNDLPGMLVHAAQHLDLESGDTPAALATGLTQDAHMAQLRAVLDRAAAHYERAFDDLSADQRAFLDTAFADVCASFRDVVMVLSDGNEKRKANVVHFVQLAQQVDVAALVAAARELATILDPAYLRGLRADLAGAGRGVIVREETPFGDIVIAGEGDQWHKGAAAILIDLGGNEHYTTHVARPLSVLVDLGGDDVYQATADGGIAAGVRGVSLLYDAAGNDRYVGRQWSQGAAALGIGVLIDAGGDDTYRSADYAQAAAFAGVGLLIDEAGSDTYEAPRYAQALAMPGGFAALIDRAGNDRYYAGGRDRTNYGTDGVFDAMSQACGIGFRGLASGGLAVLRDYAGDDHYIGDNFAQGGGYYFGWGVLVDDAGNDRYDGCRYAQAWAAHQALGYFDERGGDDWYQCWRTVGQSCSWDETVTMLIDHAGDDTYLGTGPHGRSGFALCAAHNNGLALLLDLAGADRYASFASVPRADGSDQVTSFSLHIDAGGDVDDFAGTATPNNTIRHGNRNGVFADLPGRIAPDTISKLAHGRAE